MAARRVCVAAALCVVAATGAVSTTSPASAAGSSHASRHARAVAAVHKFEANGFASRGLPARHALWVRACYRGVCAHDRLHADPVCDPEAPTCLGPAYRAVRITRRLVVSATYR